ncbi:CBS domain-containing protein [Propylenella binzhouense]|uniref:CBS domain-containing protein n=1 Tax=Propylenella binzhouense TaxID=2555902 RepID=A0A964T0U5_9HYPH|nr:CBS domain-containing protein [Propylenella binzhouense]MYZ46303.1 CBS domain-containing protein [Propylenella binzhouense]
MKTKDIMTTPVISVTPETSVPEVARLLLERHISAVPVIEPGGRLVGMVSEGDFLRRAEDGSHRHGSWWLRLLSDSGASAADYVNTHGRTAAAVMTRDVITVTEDMPVGDTAHLLETKRIKRVPVLRDGKLVGIVSRADLLRGLAASRDIAPAQTSVGDETIRKQLLDEIAHADWAPTYGLSVVVADGTVRIWGIVESPEQGEALRVAAENVPGVKAVELNVSSIPAYAWGE